MQLANWRDSPLGSKGSSLGMASRTSSSDLDKMHGIPLLLRSRASGAGTSSLPELGALLGKGSFGKVYKGAALVKTSCVTQSCVDPPSLTIRADVKACVHGAFAYEHARYVVMAMHTANQQGQQQCMKHSTKCRHTLRSICM